MPGSLTTVAWSFLSTICFLLDCPRSVDRDPLTPLKVLFALLTARLLKLLLGQLTAILNPATRLPSLLTILRIKLESVLDRRSLVRASVVLFPVSTTLTMVLVRVRLRWLPKKVCPANLLCTVGIVLSCKVRDSALWRVLVELRTRTLIMLLFAQERGVPTHIVRFLLTSPLLLAIRLKHTT